MNNFNLSEEDSKSLEQLMVVHQISEAEIIAIVESGKITIIDIIESYMDGDMTVSDSVFDLFKGLLCTYGAIDCLTDILNKTVINKELVEKYDGKSMVEFLVSKDKRAFPLADGRCIFFYYPLEPMSEDSEVEKEFAELKDKLLLLKVDESIVEYGLRIKKKAEDLYCAEVDGKDNERNRWGNIKDILSDVKYFVEFGVLPVNSDGF